MLALAIGTFNVSSSFTRAITDLDLSSEGTCNKRVSTSTDSATTSSGPAKVVSELYLTPHASNLPFLLRNSFIKRRRHLSAAVGTVEAHLAMA